jgi:hypothetical protein
MKFHFRETPPGGQLHKEEEMEDHPGEEAFETILCPSCGNENKRGSHLCSHCGKALRVEVLREETKKPFKRQSLLLGGIALVLLLAIGFFATRISQSQAVGKVNGEVISRQEFSKRVERMKRFYENRYGDDLFQGEEGTQQMNRLKAQILDEMVAEKILLQQAKNAGYASVPPEEIEKRLEEIKMKGLSDDDLERMTGGKIEDLKAELGKDWIISTFVEKAVLKGEKRNADFVFGQWFAKTRAAARIETYEKLEPVSTAKAACCTSGCGGSGEAQSLDPKIEQDAKAKGLEYYEQKTKKKGAEAKVTDFGCHVQVDIMEQGELVLSLTYSQGEIEEI